MIADKVSFGGYTAEGELTLISQEEYKLVTSSVEAAPPDPVTKTVEVPGRDGELDFTEALDGRVHYKPRKISMEFYCFGEDEELPELERDCINTLHGKKMRIYLDADPEYYYLGRLSVSWKYGENLDTVSIEAECDPYKYKRQETVCGYDVEGSLAVSLENTGWMPVSPLIEADSEMQILFGNTSAVLSPGTQKVPGLVLARGSTALTVKGTGRIQFAYREGAL